MPDIDEQERDIWNDRRPEWEKGRYIDKYGDPVHVSKLSKVFNAPDVQAGVLATSLSTVVSGMDASFISGVARSSLLGIAFLRLFEALVLQDRLNDKVIDTRPDAPQVNMNGSCLAK